MSSTPSLSRSDAVWIHSHGSELTAIPAPKRTWQWVDIDVSHSLLCALNHRSLILQTEDGWNTDERLYERLDELGHVNVLDESKDGDSGQLRFSERLLIR